MLDTVTSFWKQPDSHFWLYMLSSNKKSTKSVMMSNVNFEPKFLVESHDPHFVNETKEPLLRFIVFKFSGQAPFLSVRGTFTIALKLIFLKQ